METPEFVVPSKTPDGAPTSKYPTLTNDEKLAIREAQFFMTNTQQQAQAAVNAAQENFGRVLAGIGKKYNLDPKTTQLNSQTLEFVDAQ